MTESPAMPELAEARRAALLHAGGRTRPRFGTMLVCGLAVVGAAGVVAYPFTSSFETAEPAVVEARPVVQETVITVPAISTVRETQLAAPALLDPPPAPPPSPPPAAKPKPTVQPQAEPVERVVAPPVEPAPVVEPPAPPPVPREEPLPPPRPLSPPDRWQPLRDEIAACGSVDGLFKRAMCEQAARLKYCDGHWGHNALCPGRTEYGQ